MYQRLVRTGISTVLIAVVGIGCETKAQSGALIGGLSGAAIGGAIGSTSNARAGEGAAIGAVAGVLGGALIGHGMDKQDEKRAKAERAERYEDYSYASRGNGSVGYQPEPATRISNRDIIEWSNRGVNRDIIVDRIERSGQVFALTAADENQLRDAGVDSSVIRAMKNTSRR